MYRLLVNPGSAQAWAIPLKTGVNSIGRGAENDFTIEHDSISTFHCQIDVGLDRVLVRDLGSTNGTFVSRLLVRESELRLGDDLQLGSIKMILEEVPVETQGVSVECLEAAGAAAIHASRLHVETALSHGQAGAGSSAIAAPSPGTLEEDKPIQCRNHYQNIARYKCTKCERYVCDLCVNTRGMAGGGQKFCKICGNECVQVTFKAAVEKIDFFFEARRALAYPVLGDGLVLLFGGSFFFGFLDLANYVSRHGFKYGLRGMMMRVTIFTFIFGTGYLFSFLKKIIAATANGDPHLPDWPEFSEWQADIVAPMFQFLILTVLCFGPAAALQIWSEGDYPWLVWPAAFLGCIYFPMGFLGIAMFDSLVALNPKFAIGSILRVPREYALCVAVFCGIIGIRWPLELLLGQVLKIPLVPALIADLIMIYLLMVEARILGALYLSQKATLGWFGRKGIRI